MAASTVKEPNAPQEDIALPFDESVGYQIRLVHRVNNEDDRRKINIYLTERGKALRAELMPLAKEVVDSSVRGFSDRERSTLLEYLKVIQDNLLAGAADGDDSTE